MNDTFIPKTQAERDHETALREYESAHAVWMNTTLHSPEGLQAWAIMEQARAKYALALRKGRAIPMKVYITKYALTEGIQAVEAEIHNGMAQVRGQQQCSVGYYHGEGREWHLTIESAQTRAEWMRQKAIQSTQRKLNKLLTLKFLP